MVAGAGFEPYDLRVILALLVVMLRSTRSPPSGFVHLRCPTFAIRKSITLKQKKVPRFLSILNGCGGRI